MEREPSNNESLSRCEDDGLVIPEVGPWAKRKYHFLSRYLQMFSTGMKHKWPERHYIDLFAGAGKVKVRGDGEVLFGSAMLASQVRDPFSKIHLCEEDSVKAAALRSRLSAVVAVDKYVVHEGDANEIIKHILNEVPSRGALCVTFVDPYGLHFDFSTAEIIAQRRSDLIILMADNMDALRNWSAYYLNNPDSSLDRFMGEGGWRDVLGDAPTDQQASALRDRYFDRLRTLGYGHFATEKVMNSRGRDIYSLVFASRSKVGLKFWEQASSVDEGGQRSLFT